MAPRLRSPKQNLADLRAARKEGRTVRVRSRFGPNADLDALVLAVNEKWTVLAPIADATLDGYAIIRTAGVSSVEADPSERFHRHAIKLSGGAPPTSIPKRLDLGRTRDLITSVAAISPLVTLHLEHEWPDECYIGVPRGFKGNEVRLLEVDPQARWDDAPTRWRLGAITRVDFDGQYERMLRKVAGKPPKA